MKTLVLITAGIGFFVLLSFLFSLPVYLLWNGCLVDAITVVKEITWLQAWGISFLASLLFKPNIGSRD
jgi:hypothetical protein